MKTRGMWLLVCLLASACGEQGQTPGEPGRDNARSDPEVPQLILQVRDSESGAPVARCAIIGYRKGTELSSVTPRGPNDAADGTHRFALAPGATQVKLSAEGYSEAWTEPFVAKADEDVALSMSLRPLAHIVIHVRSTDGKAISDGAVLLVANDFEQALSVKDGRIDMHVDAIRGALVIDPESMPGFRPQDRPIQLHPGRLTELTIELRPL